MNSFIAIELLWFLPHTIFISWSLINTYTFYQQRHQQYIQKRSVSLVFGFIASLIFCMITQTSNTFGNLYLKVEIRNISYSLNTIATFIILFYLNTTNWMIHYNYHWNQYTLRLTWTQIINPNVVEESKRNNWFIKNKHKWGNSSFVYKVFGFIHLSAVIIQCIFISILLRTPNEGLRVIGTLFMTMITISLIILFCIIRRKTPSFNDIFYIHWQSKIIARILVIGYVLVFINGAVLAYFGTNNETNRRYLGSVNFIQGLVLWFIIHYVSTVVVLKKNKDGKDVTNNEKIEPKSVKLKHLLTTEESIDAFMKYLSREFSMENLLAFIEFSQFQQYLMDNMDVVSDQPRIEFPSNIPISILLENKQSDDIMTDIKIKLNGIYKKYVAVGSEFEINISSEARTQAINVLDDLDLLSNNQGISEKDLFDVVDKCKWEIWKLLLGSYYRFHQQPEYHEFDLVKVDSNSETSRRVMAA